MFLFCRPGVEAWGWAGNWVLAHMRWHGMVSVERREICGCQIDKEDKTWSGCYNNNNNKLSALASGKNNACPISFSSSQLFIRPTPFPERIGLRDPNSSASNRSPRTTTNYSLDAFFRFLSKGIFSLILWNMDNLGMLTGLSRKFGQKEKKHGSPSPTLAWQHRSPGMKSSLIPKILLLEILVESGFAKSMKLVSFEFSVTNARPTVFSWTQ